MAKTEAGQKRLKLTLVTSGQQPFFFFSGCLFGGKENLSNILRNEWACCWAPPEDQYHSVYLHSVLTSVYESKCLPLTQILHQKRGFLY